MVFEAPSLQKSVFDIILMDIWDARIKWLWNHPKLESPSHIANQLKLLGFSKRLSENINESEAVDFRAIWQSQYEKRATLKSLWIVHSKKVFFEAVQSVPRQSA